MMNIRLTVSPNHVLTDVEMIYKQAGCVCQIKGIWRCISLSRYDNRCSHLRAEQVQEKLAQGVPHVIRFRLEEGAEPFQDLVFGLNHHEVAQVRFVVISLPVSLRFMLSDGG